MFFQELKIELTDLQKLFSSDANALAKYMELYVTRKFYVGDTGINRKTLKDWESSELFPYKYSEEGWRKFSFTEWVWLECINEFRQLGVSIDKIKELRHILFDLNPEEAISFLKEQIESYDGILDQRETILVAYNHPELTPELKIQLVTELQMSPFLLFIMLIVLTDQNVCIVYNNNNFCSFFIMGTGDEELRIANQDVFSNLINDSFLVVNLKKIINKLFQKPELRHNDGFILDFLNEKEKIILEQIRNTNAKEIIITFNKENTPTHIKVNRNRISKETLNKVARYLKRGNYQTIEFTTRNGQLIKYEEKDIIKLD